MRFLVVDSDRSRYEDFQNLLEQSGLAASSAIFHANDIADAVKLVANPSVDFIFLNCSTSRNPVAQIRQLRMAAGQSPLVALASEGQEKKGLDFIRAGADDFVAYDDLTKILLLRVFRYVMSIRREIQAKADLFANLSHEMRAPLHLVLGTSDLLAETELDSEQKSLLQTLYGASRHLQTLLTMAFEQSQFQVKISEHSVLFERSDIKEFSKLLHRPFSQLKFLDLLNQFMEVPSHPYFGDEELNILVVDDDKENHKLIEAFMQSTNCSLRFALDGFEALNLAKNESFDLVLLDIEMPGLNGYETARLLKPLQLFEKCKILGLSAKAFPQDILQAKTSGFSGYLTKPISKHSLLSSIAECLKTKEFYTPSA
jgi:CheY-like chemotaxis protein